MNIHLTHRTFNPCIIQYILIDWDCSCSYLSLTQLRVCSQKKTEQKSMWPLPGGAFPKHMTSRWFCCRCGSVGSLGKTATETEALFRRDTFGARKNGHDNFAVTARERKHAPFVTVERSFCVVRRTEGLKREGTHDACREQCTVYRTTLLLFMERITRPRGRGWPTGRIARRMDRLAVGCRSCGASRRGRSCLRLMVRIPCRMLCCCDHTSRGDGCCFSTLIRYSVQYKHVLVRASPTVSQNFLLKSPCFLTPKKVLDEKKKVFSNNS
jgi:hypothetical protein